MKSAAVSTWQARGRGLPILVSIPHAGRGLPDWIMQEARVPVRELGRLSDPWSDLIAAPLLAAGARVVKANMMRAVADCNRHESDMDAADVAHALRHRFAPPGRKARAGLGVVPARLPGCGPLWRAPISAVSFERRIEEYHRPFQRAMAEACEELRRSHGRLLVIDLHSMPSLPRGRATTTHPAIVIGNRHGRSANNFLAQAMAVHASDHGMAAAINAPYAGGFITECFGDPRNSIHAIQVEFDRACYLDADNLPEAERALMLGEWLLGAVMKCLPMISEQEDWPLAAE